MMVITKDGEVHFMTPQNITSEQWDKARSDVEDILSNFYEAYGYTEENYAEMQQHILIAETCKAFGSEDRYVRRRREQERRKTQGTPCAIQRNRCKATVYRR